MQILKNISITRFLVVNSPADRAWLKRKTKKNVPE